MVCSTNRKLFQAKMAINRKQKNSVCDIQFSNLKIFLQNWITKKIVMENLQNHFLRIVNVKGVTAYEYECTRAAGFDFFAMADRVYGSEMNLAFGYKSPILCLCRPDNTTILEMGIYSNSFINLVDALNTHFGLRFKEKAIRNPKAIKKILNLL